MKDVTCSPFPLSQCELGCGLIGIGRTWGHAPTHVPSERDAITFLNHAFESGIRYFDTAPAYGTSEERLGKFLSLLTATQRDEVIVATKFGEHWDDRTGTPFTDHSVHALCRSLDESIRRLGRIDVLQLHKTSMEVLQSEELQIAWQYAKEHGITMLGASVSTVDVAQWICEQPQYNVLQMPFNRELIGFEEAIRKAISNGKTVMINRPLNMGKALYERGDESQISDHIAGEFKFIIERIPSGVILTGTKSIGHLDENMEAFRRAQATMRRPQAAG